MAREYWIVDVANNLTKDRAEFWANRWGGQAIRVREVMEGESPTQPTELEMHRADYQSVKAAGFECVGELLAAYNVLLKIAGNVHQNPQAWLLIMDGACAGVYRFERDAKEAGIDAGVKFDLIPLYANQIMPAKAQSGIRPDHSSALAGALEEFIAAGDSCTTTDDDWSAMLRFGKAVDAARSAIAAYRASQKGGNHG